ncbi:cation:dicarboxylate symporter family transporter, partial [Klebsiella pneumoniae]|uniref:cation:dicarboxylate symporter family transporter n=2 Tax=Bacteria TaxID=2 RepID=UPI003969E206
SMFFKVLLLAVIGTVLLLAIQFSIAGAIAGRSPWTSLKNMLPAYATALGTSSSAATIPVTYKAALKNGVSEKVAGF